MAIIYYVKDGPRPDNSGPGREIPIADLESRLGQPEVRYCGTTPPEINKSAPSQYPRHVVIEVEDKEPKGHLFQKGGFYLIMQLSPDEAEPKVFPSGSPPSRL